MEKSKTTNEWSKRFINLFNNYKCILIYLIIFIVLTCISDVFFTSKNIMNVVRQVAVSAILGVGFTFIVASGSIDLSVGTMISMIGILTALMSKIQGMPMIAVLAAGILIGVAAGLFNAAIINIFKLPAFIVTLANMSIYKGIAYLISNTTPISKLPSWYVAIGQGYVGPIPNPVIIMIVVMIIGTVIITKTRFGRNVLAMGGNAEAARVCGISTKRVTYGVFALIGACAAITAIVLTGRSASAQTSAGVGMELDSIAAVVIGGTPLSGGHGNIVGTVIGCLIVGTINNGLNLLNVDSNWQLIAKGILILSAIIIDAQSSRISQKFMKREKKQ